MPTEKENKKRIRRDRKEEILQAATHLFSINGFRGTSLASIAEEVGLTEQGVLHYFPSKANLLQSVFAYRDQQDEDKYSKFIDRDSLSLEEMFDALEKLVAQNEQIPGLVRLFSVLVGESIRNDHPSHEYFDQRYKRIRDVFTEHLSTLVDIDISSDINPKELASLIVAVMDGLQIQWLLDPENMSMSDAFDLFSRVITTYLKR